LPFRDFNSSAGQISGPPVQTGDKKLVSYIQRHDNYNLDSLIDDALARRAILKKYNLKDTIALPDIKVIANRTNEYQEAVEKNYASARGMKVGGGRIVRDFNKPVEVSGPLVIIDGMESDGYFPSSLIESVVFLTGGDAAVWGKKGESGVISIISKKDWESTHTPYLHSVKINITGYYEPRIFYSPKHTTKLDSDYKPDLRKTLFWKPYIVVNENETVVLSYSNSDRSSLIRVTAEGISSRGVPVSCVKEYKVK
jgi:hypothetical protein